MRSSVQLAVLVACGVVTLPAQVYRPRLTPGQQLQQQQSSEDRMREQIRQQNEREEQLRQRMFPYNTMPKDAPFPFHLVYRPGLQQMFPRYEGTPTYPDAPGEGGGIGAGKNTDEPAPGLPGLADKEARRGRWPSWIEGGTGAAGQATADQSVLVRITDRVWLRPPGERAFVPLAFYDRFRFLQTGGEVDVGGKGEYQVMMYDGGTLRSRGPCRLAVAGMSDAALELRLDVVQQIWLVAKTRPVRLQLPDHTILEFSDTQLYLERRGDRIRVSNEGRKPIRFTGTAGEGQVEGPRYIAVWTAPPARPQFGHALELMGGVTRTEASGVTVVRGGADGRVVWSGARFEVGAGASLRVESLPPLQSARQP